MGEESGVSILGEYWELFDELGQPEGAVELIKVNRENSNYDEPTLVPMSLGRVIIDDPNDREKYPLVSLDRRIFRVWGGSLAPDEESLLFGDGLTAEARIQAAMIPGGGIRYGGKILPITDYYRGFGVENVVTNWYIITESIRLVE